MAKCVDQGTVGALEQLLSERQSCRGFQDRQVPPGVIDRLLDMAQLSPSWCNTQPWELVVLGGDATDRMRNDFVAYAESHPENSDFPFPERYSGKHLERRRECGWQLYEAVGVEKGDREGSRRQAQENFRFFGAPNVALLTTEAELGVYGLVDCGIYVSNFLLAAQSLGLGAIAQAALATHSDFFRDRLNLPENRKFVLGISFGYADPNHPANNFRTRRVQASSAVTRLS